MKKLAAIFALFATFSTQARECISILEAANRVRAYVAGLDSQLTHNSNLLPYDFIYEDVTTFFCSRTDIISNIKRILPQGYITSAFCSSAPQANDRSITFASLELAISCRGFIERSQLFIEND